MLERIEGLPPNVVAVRAEQTITADDYARVLVPAVERAMETGGRVRMLYALGPEFEHFEAGALWADAKLGSQHLGDFECIAVVSDHERIAQAVEAFGLFIPCPVKVFAVAELESAKTWVQETTSDGLRVQAKQEGDTAYIEAKLSGSLGEALERELVETVRASIQEAGHVRVLVEANDFHGWSDIRALWMHLKLVAGARSKIERLAIVGDAGWQRRMLSSAKFVLGVDARYFEPGQLEDARSWVHG